MKRFDLCALNFSIKRDQGPISMTHQVRISVKVYSQNLPFDSPRTLDYPSLTSFPELTTPNGKLASFHRNALRWAKVPRGSSR